MKKNLLHTAIISPHQTILVALSGGPDSVCLLYQLHALAKEYNLTLLAAHLNHEWRGLESDQDQEFCKKLCEKFKIPFFSKRLSELESLPKYNGSKEQYARQARRKFLEHIAQENKADAIALAHHQDDQLETFFIRLIRGTSLAGLTGMKLQQGLYIRPLLYCSKQEILDFLHAYTIAYQHDASNNSEEFLRNRIRKNLIPTLEKVDHRTSQNILNFMDHALQAETYLEIHTNLLISSLTEAQGFDTRKFLQQPLYMQYRILTHLLISHKIPITLQQSFLDECIRFLKKTKANRHILHPSWALIKQGLHFNFQKIL